MPFKLRFLIIFVLVFSVFPRQGYSMIEPGLLEKNALYEGRQAFRGMLCLDTVPVFKNVLGDEKVVQLNERIKKNPYDVPDYTPTPLPEGQEGHVISADQMLDLKVHWDRGFGNSIFGYEIEIQDIPDDKKPGDEGYKRELSVYALKTVDRLRQADLISVEESEELTRQLKKYFSDVLSE